MADTARGKVSMTPVVTIDADLDADAVDAIHHDIKGSLGGKLEYVAVDGFDKWFYSTSTDVTASHANLISGNFTSGGSGVDVFTLSDGSEFQSNMFNLSVSIALSYGIYTNYVPYSGKGARCKVEVISRSELLRARGFKVKDE